MSNLFVKIVAGKIKKIKNSYDIPSNSGALLFLAFASTRFNFTVVNCASNQESVMHG